MGKFYSSCQAMPEIASILQAITILSHIISVDKQKSEKERLYSLCYLHTGAPRVWYSVAGCHRHKFKAFMESFVPKMSGEQSKKSYDSVITSTHYDFVSTLLCSHSF